MAYTQSIPENGTARVGDLVHRITDDLKILAKDELELVKGEVQHTAKTAAAEGAVIVLGGIVALIGLGMLCAAAVAAIGPAIHSYAVALLIMAGAYIVAGGVVAGVFARRLGKDIRPDTTIAGYEAQRTLHGVKAQLTEEGIHA